VEITEVRIKLMEDGGDRLKAFCSITFDNCFVVRDLKIIEGSTGPFVAMPSRKLTSHCPQCGCKNHLRSAYCNQCGSRMKEGRGAKDEEGRTKLYADIAHPINSHCREMIQARVIEAYDSELELAQQPGYVSRYDDYDYDGPEPHFEAQPRRAPDQQGADQPSTSQARTEPREEKKPAPHTPPQSKKSTAKPKSPDSFGEGIF
jgi:stage V sporulation protein G